MPAATPPNPPTSSERPPATRCILWRPPSLPTPPELLTSLQRRAIHITDCTDPYAALAHICRLEYSPPDRIILLLVSPAHLPDAPRALDTAARYAPHAACWWYDARTSDKLRRITPSDIAAWTALHAPSAAPISARPSHNGAREPSLPPLHPAHRPAPALRLISDDADPTDPPPDERPALNGAPHPIHDPVLNDDPGAIPSPTTLLTNEELAMLLADPPAAPEAPQHTATQRTPWWRRPEHGGDR